MRGAGDPEWHPATGANLLNGGAQALSARARQLTPQAYEREMPYVLNKKLLHAVLAGACLGALAAGGTATAQEASTTGGAAFIPPPPPPKKAKIGADGRVIAPRSAPRRVKRVITAANRLIGKPYRYGGGHKPFSRILDGGYDCSGSVSYALYGGRFVRSPLASGDLMTWARRKPGRWITVYANSGH